MLSNAEIKFINSLKIKKYRQKAQLFLIEGEKLAAEFLGAPLPINNIYATQGWQQQNQNLIGAREVKTIDEKELGKISGLSTPNEVLLVAQIPVATEQKLEFAEPVLALDDIRDPGNLGTLIRIADWFGLEALVCSVSCVDAYNPKVVQSSMGSLARVKLWYQDLSAVFRSYPGTPVYGAVLDADNLFEAGELPNGFVLIGNESAGISKDLLPLITKKLSIPRYGQAESLNAAVAAALFCAELKRR